MAFDLKNRVFLKSLTWFDRRIVKAQSKNDFKEMGTYIKKKNRFIHKCIQFFD